MLWAQNKRYNTLDGYYKARFGCKVAKISLNAGFTCPNRDGTKAYGGCIYCSPSGSGDFAGDPRESIREQFFHQAALMRAKWPDAKFLPYFQAGTNTYAPLCRLKEVYGQALSLPDCVGLSIATRPDCISDEVLDCLAEIASRTYLTVELGLQTVFDDTGEKINRQTTYAEFENCYRRLSEKSIPVCVHLINGLPGENRERMLESVRRVSLLRPHAVKLHMLHILKDTACAVLYERGEIRTFEKEEYIELVCDELELLHPDIVVQRITGDGGRETLIAPLWSLKKFDVMNGVDRLLRLRDSYQGKYCPQNT